MVSREKPRSASVGRFASLQRSATLSEQAVHSISAAIDRGELKPGDRLVEAQLAEQFQISRGPLREALRVLEAQGLVERNGTAGSFVSNPSRDNVAHAIILRGTIEGLGARFAATGDHSVILPALERAYEDMARAAAEDDRTSFFDAHRTFHMTLCEATGSPLLRQLNEIVRAQIELHVRRIGWPDIGYERMLANHRRFIESVESRDPGKAEATIRNIIVSSGLRSIDRPVPDAIRDLME